MQSPEEKIPIVWLEFDKMLHDKRHHIFEKPINLVKDNNAKIGIIVDLGKNIITWQNVLIKAYNQQRIIKLV